MSEEPLKYAKTCRGCKKAFRSDARNAQFAPASVCKCLENRSKNRAKRAKERRIYHKNPEHFKAKSRSRALARKTVLAHFGVVVKGKTLEIDKTKIAGLGCNCPGCETTLHHYLKAELKSREEKGVGSRGAIKAAVKKLLSKLEAHHRDHDWSNNFFEAYPERSNIELLCRKHHEHADRAKAGKAEIILVTPQNHNTKPIEALVDLRHRDPRKFWLTPAAQLLREYTAKGSL